MDLSGFYSGLILAVAGTILIGWLYADILGTSLLQSLGLGFGTTLAIFAFLASEHYKNN